jgi:myo-inositol-1(or 4)-monophosphatase
VPFAQGRNGLGDQQDDAAFEALLAPMRDAAARAAAFIAEHASRIGDLTWEHKGPADFVSDVDRGAEAIVRDALLAAFPDAVFLGEETYDPEASLGEALSFVVDPLDGTTNFLHGFPWYAVSIGAAWAGEPIAGVVRNVPTGETFLARRGGGAWRERDGVAGRERIHVSSVTDPARALIGTGFPFKSISQIDAYQRHFAAIAAKTAGIRRPGAAALDLCDVACGRFEGFWELTLSPWDLAAGITIVREAGGVITDLDGGEARIAHTGLVVGSPAMHAWLLATIESA